MERATKLIVVAWVGVAIAMQVWLLAPGWDRLPIASVVVFVLTAGLAVRWPRTISLVLVFIYPAPVLIWLAAGGYTAPLMVLWMAALVGAMTPDLLARSWQIASPWRGILICWALVIVVGASITVARELDFQWSLIYIRGREISNSATGGWPAYWITWILNDALVALIGILWFDWLSALSEREFVRNVATPLVVSFGVMALVSLYQLTVDVTALNQTAFGGTGRAAGTLLDANVAGMIGVLWIAGAVLYSRAAGKRTVAIAGFAAGWVVVWASGSRDAFGAATVVALFELIGLIVEHRRTAAVPIGRIAVAGAIALALLVALARMPNAVGPLKRFHDSFPRPSLASAQTIANALWNRDGWGTIGNSLIATYPWTGVGVGSFPILAADMARAPHDNAQNWFRQELAELGIFGSLPLVAWTLAFAWFVFRRRRERADLRVWSARGALVAFTFASLFGVPSQALPVTLTFWAIVFWFVLIAGGSPTRWRMASAAWVVVSAVVIAFAAATAHAAANELRVPVRANVYRIPYAHGFYEAELDAAGQEFRWTGRRAVATIEARTSWLALTVSVGHPDVDAHPVDVKIWRDGELIINDRLRTTAERTEYVRIVPVAESFPFPTPPRVLIETWASRTFRPGHGDDRDLGLKLRWKFVDAPSP